MLLPQVKNISVSRIQTLHPNIMFPNLATMKTVLTRLQCCSFKRSTMADHEVILLELQANQRKGEGKKERNCKDKNWELCCMTFCGCSTWKWHEKRQNLKEVAYYWINAQISEKHGINYYKRDYYRSKCKIPRLKLWWNKAWKKKKYPDFLESQFVIMCLCDSLFSKTMCPRLATRAAKHSVCFLPI